MGWYKKQAKANGIAVKSGSEIDFETGSVLEINAIPVSATASELNKLHNLTASTAELNLWDGVASQATYTIGAEGGGGTTINVGIQLKDADGGETGTRQGMFVYLSDDANGDAIVASAPSGGWAIGTDGLLIPIVAGKAGWVVSEADGDIDITITEAGAKTCYMILVMPNGKLAASAAITFA